MLASQPFTWLCLLVAFGAPLAAGVPLVSLARGGRPLSAADWLLAPFAGLGALVLVLQNLVYLGVPVGRSAPWAWWVMAAALACWAVRGAARASLASFPRAAYALALLAYAAHGWALLQLGARTWMGRAWEDQYSYDSMAQLLLEAPFDTSASAVGQRSYLFRALRPSLGKFALPFGLKENRIGQSVQQAFSAASLGSDVKPLFGPTITLCGPWLVLAGLLLAGRLGLPRGLAWLSAWLAALLPGTTLLQLESFLSHALALAFFLVWLVLLDDLGREPRAGTLLLTVAVLSYAVATYGELWPLLLLLAGLALAGAACSARRLVAPALVFAVLALAPRLLNPHFFHMLLVTILFGSEPEMHTAIYPWAESLEGLARLWLGDLTLGPVGPRPWALAAGLTATLAAGAALAWGLRRAAAPGRQATSSSDPSLALCASLAALACAPLALWLLPGKHPYQFYKLLQTAAPAWALALGWGVARLGERARQAGARPALRRGAHLAVLAFAVWTLAATVSSLAMIQDTTRTTSRVGWRHNGYVLDPAWRDAYGRLETLRGQALVFGRGLWPALNAWLGWAARHNAVWLAEPFLGRDHLRRSPEAAALLDLPKAPAGAWLLSHAGDRSFERPPGSRSLWRNAWFELWAPGSGPWVRLFDVERVDASAVYRARVDLPNLGAEWVAGRAPLRMLLLSGAAGQARLWVAWRPRPDVPQARLQVEGCVEQPPLGGRLVFLCPLQAGFSESRWMAEAPGARDSLRLGRFAVVDLQFGSSTPSGLGQAGASPGLPGVQSSARR